MVTTAVFTSKITSIKENDLMALPITPLDTLKTEACEKMKYKVELYMTFIQAIIVTKLYKHELRKKFVVDRWNREQGGGGITCVLQEGDTFDKAGVNISALWGQMSKEHVKVLRSRGKDISLEGENKYFATGLSLMLQPVNPFVPSLHVNLRYFEVHDSSNKCSFWFGCHTDLMPNYVFEKDFIDFHESLKNVCDQHDISCYEKYKQTADDYNYNVHRDEHCGVGGISFDDLTLGSIDDGFAFITNIADAVIPTYISILDRHINDKYSDDQKRWQLIRRGRYVEFNLVYGRGTKFGLKTPGVRIESILMTMPLNARWEYMPSIETGIDEEAMMRILRHPKNWTKF